MKGKIFIFGLVFFISIGYGIEPTRAVEIKAIVSSNHPKLSGQLFHPSVCPNDVNLVTFVQQEKDNRQLWMLNAATGQLSEISPNKKKKSVEDISEDNEDVLFQNYTDQLSWCPVLHKKKQYIAYVSAGRGNNMDVYLHAIGSDLHTRVTSHAEVDESPKWSPDGKKLIFISARTGNGDIYLIEDITELLGKKITKEPRKLFFRLTKNKNEDMLPAFSPDGRYIAYTARTKGTRKRGPYTIGLMDLRDSKSKFKIQLFNNRIVNSKSHPSWSFDGNFVAYQISNDIKDQAIDVGVLQLKKDPKGRLIELTDLVGTIPKIAENIFPNGYEGPSWLPGSRALLYAKRESKRLNPLEVVNLEQWLYNQNYKRQTIPTISSIHRDVFCLHNHPIAVYSGQSGLTYTIFAAFLQGGDVKIKGRSPRIQDYAIFK